MIDESEKYYRPPLILDIIILLICSRQLQMDWKILSIKIKRDDEVEEVEVQKVSTPEEQLISSAKEWKNNGNSRRKQISILFLSSA